MLLLIHSISYLPRFIPAFFPDVPSGDSYRMTKILGKLLQPPTSHCLVLHSVKVTGRFVPGYELWD